MTLELPFLVKRYAPFDAALESPRPVVGEYAAATLSEALRWCRTTRTLSTCRWIERRHQPATLPPAVRRRRITPPA